MRRRPILFALIGLLILAPLVLLGVIKSRSYGEVRKSAAAAVTAATGRACRMAGALHLELGLAPVLVAGDVRLAGEPWDSRPDMIHIERVEAGVDLLPLLAGTVRIRRLHLVEPRILVEQNEAGKTNLDFRPSRGAFGQKGAARPLPQEQGPLELALDRVTVEQGLLTYREVRSGRFRVVRLTRLTASAPGLRQPIGLEMKGSFEDRPFEARGEIGSLFDMLTPGTAWRADITAHPSGDPATRVRIQKTIRPGAGDACAALQVTGSMPERVEASEKEGDASTPSRIRGPGKSSRDGEPAPASRKPPSKPASKELPASKTASHELVAPAASSPPRYTGDLDALLERERIRVLVSYDRTNFFIARGELFGLEYEMMNRFGDQLNRTRGKGQPPVEMVFLPLPRDRLLSALAEGQGDIAAAGLAPSPHKGILFAEPYEKDVERIFVTHRSAPAPRTLEDLAGRTVHVTAGSSDIASLKKRNERLKAKGLSPMRIVEAGEDLVTEDLYEMIHAGVFSLTVGPEDSARLWSRVFPDLVPLDHLPAGPPQDRAWAVRTDSPNLLAALNAYVPSHKKGTRIGNILFHRYDEATHWIRNPLDSEEREKLDAYRGYFQKYARRYGLEWLAVAAQAYQESGLDQSRRSDAGAVGLMQLMPETASQPPVSIPDITNPGDNVHAGVKYLAYLLNEAFSDPAIDPKDQYDFALAAYNAGPGRVHRLRKRTRSMGLDPNRWFGNVEHAALAEIGNETVRYVANIRKYELAYRFAMKELEKRTQELEKEGLKETAPSIL